MKSKITLFTALAILLLASSCITPKQTNLLQDIEKNYPVDDKAAMDYKIIPGDQLSISIYTLDEEMKDLFASFIYDGGYSSNNNSTQQASLGGRESVPYNVLTVTPQGTVKIPYIGHVNVLDLTILEANRTIAEKFRNFSASVQVEVNLRNRYFFVLGELGAKPIQMPHLRMTIYQALAQSGSIETFGDRKQVKILRQTSSGTEIKTFDIRSKDIVNSDYYYIQPNDVIYMPQMQRKFFGAATSFNAIFGLVTTLLGTAVGIWALVDKN